MINNLEEADVNHCLRDLFDENQEIRINAINQLGEVGDELCLQELRDQLKFINIEHQALIIAIDKLKQKLGIK